MDCFFPGEKEAQHSKAGFNGRFVMHQQHSVANIPYFLRVSE